MTRRQQIFANISKNLKIFELLIRGLGVVENEKAKVENLSRLCMRS
jgi:hypothetical protein